MRNMQRVPARSERLFVILLALLVSVLLLILDAVRFFPQAAASHSLLFDTVRFGFSVLVAMVFLAVGALVWLYARDRRIAWLLFCFSFAMMVSFTVQTGAAANDTVLSIIGDTGSAVSPYLFLLLLLLFPKDYLSPSLPSSARSENGIQTRHKFALWLRRYLIVLAFLGAITVLDDVFYHALTSALAGLLNGFDGLYFLLVLTSILLTIIVSYRRSSALRERQQLRLFVIGVVLAFTPFLLLTLLPGVVGLPAQYTVDSQVSTLTAILLPLALGYSILRYQILVIDAYVRRAVAWTLGAVSLALLGYAVGVLSSLWLSDNQAAQIGFIILALLLLAPCIWWLAHVLAERLFFSEILHYRRLVDNPDLLARETLNIDEASELLTLALVNTFETREVCLFVLDRETGYYHLSPALNENEPQDASRMRLVQQFLAAGNPSADDASAVYAAALDKKGWIEAELPLLQVVVNAKRPLFLSEAANPQGEQPTGLARFLVTSALVEKDPLLAAVRVQGRMIGLLLLGERGDRQQYGGPDFEAIELILARFSPVLETARLYEQASRHVATLNALYSANVALEKSYQSIEEAATTYATVAAQAVRAGVVIWLSDADTQSLKQVCRVGEGPDLPGMERIASLLEGDWEPWFYESSSPHPSDAMPSCLSQAPTFPFAWLPLEIGQQRFGILALTYPRPHVFSVEEKRILGMFAGQCAAAMDNAQVSIALRQAYELQKELDHLKDQFIITASHELRTPLTAVQGYIELLHNFHENLAPEERRDFIAKAQRGCDELVLMVGNIMDASRVQVDVEQVKLEPTCLRSAVTHVLEIMEGVARKENRRIRVDIPDTAFVMADEQRLKQVVLNLVGNAFKYSPPGSPIEISVHCDDGLSTLCIRDYGKGILPEDQNRLFERFMRLERDMNSPVRGAGLGLYISKQLVEAMGGSIWVESSGIEGEGSVFAFSLKLSQPAQVPVP